MMSGSEEGSHMANHRNITLCAICNESDVAITRFSQFPFTGNMNSPMNEQSTSTVFTSLFDKQPLAPNVPVMNAVLECFGVDQQIVQEHLLGLGTVPKFCPQCMYKLQMCHHAYTWIYRRMPENSFLHNVISASNAIRRFVRVVNVLPEVSGSSDFNYTETESVISNGDDSLMVPPTSVTCHPSVPTYQVDTEDISDVEFDSRVIAEIVVKGEHNSAPARSAVTTSTGADSILNIPVITIEDSNDEVPSQSFNEANGQNQRQAGPENRGCCSQQQSTPTRDRINGASDPYSPGEPSFVSSDSYASGTRSSIPEQSSSQQRLYASESQTREAVMRVTKLHAPDPASSLQCGSCDAMFGTIGYLLCHAQKAHWNDTELVDGREQYSCKFGSCKFTTMYYQSFKSHMLIHSGEKPFKCNYKGCDYAARQKSCLSNHQKVHHDRSPSKFSSRASYTKKRRGFTPYLNPSGTPASDTRQPSPTSTSAWPTQNTPTGERMHASTPILDLSRPRSLQSTRTSASQLLIAGFLASEQSHSRQIQLSQGSNHPTATAPGSQFNLSRPQSSSSSSSYLPMIGSPLLQRFDHPSSPVQFSPDSCIVGTADSLMMEEDSHPFPTQFSVGRNLPTVESPTSISESSYPQSSLEVGISAVSSLPVDSHSLPTQFSTESNLPTVVSPDTEEDSPYFPIQSSPGSDIPTGASSAHLPNENGNE